MTREEASDILELSPHASPTERSLQYDTLRRQLEDKLAKAPTPGLREKYRANLKQLEDAFAVLAQTDDSASLPLAQRNGGGPASLRADSPVAGVADPGALRAAAQTPGSATPATATRRKSGGKEFAVIAVIAVALLGAGGWWVMKTRAENAEKTRIVEETKSAAEAKAAGDKAEAERTAEKVRLAAEVEKTRQEKLTGQLRSALAEYKVEWEAIEREERNAERRLAEVKSDLRSLRDVPAGQMAQAQALVAAQQAFYDWLSETLARHPAKIARSQAEEMLAARQLEEASAAVAVLKAALAGLAKDIPERRTALLDLEGELALRTDADTTWTLTDAFGRIRSGRGSAQLAGLAVGAGRLQLSKLRWPLRMETFVIRRDRPVEIAADYVAYSLNIGSEPTGAEVRLADGTSLGLTPLQLDGLPPGALTLTVQKEGYFDGQLALTLPLAETEAQRVTLQIKPTGLVKPLRWNSPAHVRFDARQNMDMSGAVTSTTSNHIVEEWDFSQPDPQFGWRQITRKHVSYVGSNATSAPVAGSVMRQQRQSDGKWTGEFIQGGLADPTHNSIWTSIAPSLWLVLLGLYEVWPSQEVPVGGTWTVQTEKFFPMIGFGANTTGQVEGRLIAIQRDANEEWASIEFNYTYVIGEMRGQAVVKLQVNLRDGYVERAEGRDGLTSSINTRSSYTISVSKR